jgi:hypothetical protein
MRSTTTQKTAVYTLRVERRKLERLRKIAEADHRTLSQELRHMIEERIARSDADKEAAAQAVAT